MLFINQFRNVINNDTVLTIADVDKIFVNEANGIEEIDLPNHNDVLGGVLAFINNGDNGLMLTAFGSGAVFERDGTTSAASKYVVADSFVYLVATPRGWEAFAGDVS